MLRRLPRFLITFVLALSLGASGCSSSFQKKSEFTYRANYFTQNLLNPVVSVWDNDFLIGSGVVVRWEPNKKILILTARHVADAIEKQGFIALCANPNLECSDHIPVTTVKVSDKDIDLALLQSEIPTDFNGPEADIASKEPMVGDDLYVVGSPNQHAFNVSKGILSTVYVQEGVKLYRTDADIYFGNSGGPVYNDDGEVVGVVSALEATGLLGMIVPGSGTLIPLNYIWHLVYNRPLP